MAHERAKKCCVLSRVGVEQKRRRKRVWSEESLERDGRARENVLVDMQSESRAVQSVVQIDEGAEQQPACRHRGGCGKGWMDWVCAAAVQRQR